MRCHWGYVQWVHPREPSRPEHGGLSKLIMKLKLSEHALVMAGT